MYQARIGVWPGLGNRNEILGNCCVTYHLLRISLALQSRLGYKYPLSIRRTVINSSALRAGNVEKGTD